jgi:tetratricopeptide (TPR) repeat protein
MEASIESGLISALNHYHGSRFAEAEAELRGLSRLAPDEPLVNYNLGVLLVQKGDFAGGLPLLQRALDAEPGQGAFWIALIGALSTSGDLDRARKLLVQARARGIAGEAIDQIAQTLDEPSAEAIGALHDLLSQQNFATCERRALSFTKFYPWHHAGWLYLSECYWAMGKFNDAIDAMRVVADILDFDANFQLSYASALLSVDQPERAEPVLRRALALDPNHGDAYLQLAISLDKTDRPQDSVVPLISALALKPAEPAILNQVGAIRLALNSPHSGTKWLDRSLSVDRQNTDAWCWKGLVHVALGQAKGSIASFRAALEIDPNRVDAHANLGWALLGQGEFETGFAEMEWRRRIDPSHWRGTPAQQWAGQDLTGKTLVIYTEQGFGDSIQFSRYISLVANPGTRVVVEAPQPLIRLLATVNGVSDIVPWGTAEQCGIVPDYFVPMMSLPGLLKTRIDTIPAPGPYIAAQQQDVSAWGQRLAECEGLRVGLVWAGESRGNIFAVRTDRRRSVTLRQLAPLFSVEGISWISLQKGAGRDQIEPMTTSVKLIDFTDDLNDFADTAALIENLDLVISVDTAVAHVAAALGKPVWVLSRFDGCWRWLAGRDDSPWYPSLRLYRQTQPGQWEPVIHQLVAALKAF